MRNIKGVLTLTLITVLLIGSISVFAAANKKYEGESLKILAAKHFLFDAVKEVIPKFERETGAKVDVTEVDATRLYDKIKLNVSSQKSSYDVVMVDMIWLGEFGKRRNLLLPLKDHLSEGYDLDDIIDTYLKADSMYDGKLYTLPIGVQGTFLAYRRDIFEKYGEVPPQTMEELMETAKSIYEKSDGEIYGITLRGRRGHGIVFSWSQFLWAFGGQPMNYETMKPTLDSDEAVESLEFYVELLNSAGPPDVGSYTFDSMFSSWTQGSAAMYLDASVAGFWEKGAIPEISGKIGYDIMPRKKGEPHTGSLGGWGLGVPAASSNQSLAVDFIQFASNKENAEVLIENGRAAIRESTFSDQEVSSEYWWYPKLEMVAKVGEPNFRPRIPEYPQLEQALGKELSAALSGIKEPKEALKDANEQWREILSEAGYYE